MPLQNWNKGGWVRVDYARQLESDLNNANHQLNKKYIEYDQLFDEAEKIRIERDQAREALRELWQTADAYIPQIDQEQAAKWHKAMFGDSDK